MATAARSPLARLRKICLALPDAHEVEAWGEPTFRVNNKLFAMYAADNNHHGAGRSGVWVKSAHVTQDMLVRAQPDRYFSPPYVGPKGWTGAYLDRTPDWEVVEDLVRDAYMLTVPRRLKAKLESAKVTATPTAKKSAKASNAPRTKQSVRTAKQPTKNTARPSAKSSSKKSAEATKKRR